MLIRWIALFWLSLATSLAGASELVPLPTLSARVTDLTGTLTADQRGALESASAVIERDKGSQVAVLILPTTQPESIEQFGIRLAEAWKVGRNKTDDGVIIIVAKDDRKMRIEVGYGLEGAIPDVVAKRIVSDIMAPAFRQGDFAGGLDAAVATIGRVIGGEPLPAPDAEAGAATGIDGGYLVLGLFLVIMFGRVLRSLFGGVGSLAVAGIAGWLGWAIFATLFAAGIAAIVAFLFSLTSVSGWHTGRGGGWPGGGLPGGGGFGGGGSGGWSGGGGGFGGGGASGSW